MRHRFRSDPFAVNCSVWDGQQHRSSGSSGPSSAISYPGATGPSFPGATLEEVGFDERATMAGMRQLFDATTKLMPQAREAWFQDVRVGLRPGTPDDIPVIGPSPRLFGLVYATGHFRSGILLAPLTASLVCDLILDQKHDPVFEQTSPARFGN